MSNPLYDGASVANSQGVSDAAGTTVYLSANGLRQRGDVLSGGSYLSSNDLRVHFGLGDAGDAGRAEIHCPPSRRRRSGFAAWIASTP